MDRRQFFKKGLKGAADAALSVANKKVANKAAHWIRPPFAQPELDFLLTCTRCGDCTSSCPHQVIFPLPIARGAEVAATPAMDLLNKGCHLCEDWPCVSACKVNALELPTAARLQQDVGHGSETESQNQTQAKDAIQSNIQEHEFKPLPKLALATIEESQCLPYQGPECGACKGSCPVPDTLTWQNERPKIDRLSCVGCGLCRESCITNPKSVAIASIPKTEQES